MKSNSMGSYFMSEQRFHVVWEMDIYAGSPSEAASQAWEHMRRPDSTANVFAVFDGHGVETIVDLMEEDPA